ncbi:MAG: hypothetical protein D0433_06525 [Candidatus Thermochlorobacter aerophilum]|uniref:Uncharacterized protein n=1 Tax=Candidatus Thermochlorobacter aerophilus TaxID=1868324 RepID=A0A395M0S9_9BACT|nr:MAG: hypothetical protein D0433_06525 [Candidatus Thermochlorobacter aerophilum]
MLSKAKHPCTGFLTDARNDKEDHVIGTTTACLFCIIVAAVAGGSLSVSARRKRKENEKSGAVFFAIAYILNKPKFDLRLP